MAVIDHVARPFRVFVGSEAEVLWSDLEYHRSTFLWKCEGLDEQQLRLRSARPSTLSLLELIRHLTGAERHWFQETVAGRSLEPQYPSVPGGDWPDPDEPTPVSEIVHNYLVACEESRQVAAEHALDEVIFSDVFDTPVTFRFIAVHLIEEYARHCGHADLLREAIDGAVGE